MIDFAEDQLRSGCGRDRFSGDRRLFCIEGPVGPVSESADNPESLCAGCPVHLPRSVRASLRIGDGLSFVLTEVRRYRFGSMGFCEVEGQPGQGVWVRLRHLTRSDWHTFQASRPHPAIG